MTNEELMQLCLMTGEERHISWGKWPDCYDEEAQAIHICQDQLSKAISIIAQEKETEVNSRWISSLKKYNFTVDSPESLAVSIDVLLEEKRKEVAQEIKRELEEVMVWAQVPIIDEEGKIEWTMLCAKEEWLQAFWDKYLEGGDQEGKTSRLTWDDYFLSIAEVVSCRSTCPRARVGAVIVSPDNRILSTGYNGSPPGEPHCDTAGCLVVDNHCQRTLHAEVNAIAFAAGAGVKLAGGILYIWSSRGDIVPCRECEKVRKAAGLRLWSEIDVT